MAPGSAPDASGSAASTTGAGHVPTPVSPTAGATDAGNPTFSERIRQPWTWLAASCAVLAALLAIIVIARSRRSGEPAEGDASRLPAGNRRASMLALQRSCKANDARGAARALLDVARITWPDRPTRGLSELAAHMAPGRGRNEVMALDRNLYASGRGDWRGDALWSAVEQGLRPAGVAAQLADDGLEPLYP